MAFPAHLHRPWLTNLERQPLKSILNPSILHNVYSPLPPPPRPEMFCPDLRGTVLTGRPSSRAWRSCVPLISGVRSGVPPCPLAGGPHCRSGSPAPSVYGQLVTYVSTLNQPPHTGLPSHPQTQGPVPPGVLVPPQGLSLASPAWNLIPWLGEVGSSSSFGSPAPRRGPVLSLP